MENMLPQTLYVHMEDCNDGDYFPLASASFEDLDNATVVGVYELLRVQKVVVTTDLQ